MSTVNRIVLLDRKGEELFSGDSLLSEPPRDEPVVDRPEGARDEPPYESNHDDDDDDDEEQIPATLRSSVMLRAREPVSRPIIVDEVNPPTDTGHRAA